MTNSNIEKELQEIKQLLSNQSFKPMTISEASSYLNLSKSYLYKMTSAGKIPFFKPSGKKLFFTKSQLDNWIQRNPIKSKYEIEEMADNYILNSKRKS